MSATPPGPRLRLSDQILFVVLGTGFRALAELGIAVVLARLLSKTDFGTYRQVFLIYGMLASFISLGLPASFSYFIPGRPPDAARALAWRTYSLLASLSLPAVLVILFVRDFIAAVMNNPALASLLVLAALFPLCQVVVDALPHLLVALERHRLAGSLSLAMAVVFATAVLVPACLRQGLGVILPCAAAAAALNCAVTLGVTWRLLRPGQGAAPVHGAAPGNGAVPGRGAAPGGEDSPRLREQLAYALPLGASVMAGSVYLRLDRFLISLFYPPATLAVYSVGATEIPLVPVLPYTVGRTLIPHFTRLNREGRTAEILPLWGASIVKTSLVLLPVFALCFILAPQIIRLLYGPGFGDAAAVFRIYLLLLPLRPTAYGTVLQALGDTRTVLKGGLMAVALNATAGIGLTAIAGWLGPALGAVLAQVALIGYYLHRIGRLLACPLSQIWPWRRYFVTWGVTLIATLAATPLLLLPAPSVVRISLLLALFLSVYIGAIWRLGEIGRSEWDLLKRWLSLGVFRSVQ